LYDYWKNNGNEIHNYIIITTVPNTIFGRYHDEMPVILEKEDEDFITASPGYWSRSNS